MYLYGLLLQIYKILLNSYPKIISFLKNIFSTPPIYNQKTLFKTVARVLNISITREPNK